MKEVKRAILWIAAALALAAPCGAAAPDAVRIYLPRDVQVDGESLTLGEIGVVLCSDTQLEAKAAAIAMGRAPWPTETIVVDRRTILSRLAASGIAHGRVNLAGAPRVAVTRNETTFSGERILAAAGEFLGRSPAGKDGCVFSPLRKPQPLTVSGGRGVALVCSLDETAPANGPVRVAVRAVREGKQLALREVLFKRMYAIRQAVAVKVILAGEKLTDENIEIRTIHSDRPAQAGWTPPNGLMARRRLMPGTVIGAAMTASHRPDLHIRRNQLVRLRVQGRGFLVTGAGQALQDGRCGDFIKVLNVDTDRIVIGRIAFDGAVEPTFKR